ncbi:MAG: hypothetical protein KDE26_29465 [Bacteroidetes bacterium]|nr:hypothetical protein [Bacteroidota bacterium]MCB0847429.1 hypothetical protein [Bacteroidota bacterium]
MATDNASISPKVIRLGRVTKNKLKKFKNGHGKMANEFDQILDRVRSQYANEDGQEVHPVVVFYREKERKKKHVKIGGMKVKRKKLKRMFPF